jgi:hypothetical protein
MADVEAYSQDPMNISSRRLTTESPASSDPVPKRCADCGSISCWAADLKRQVAFAVTDNRHKLECEPRSSQTLPAPIRDSLSRFPRQNHARNLQDSKQHYFQETFR